MIMKRLNEKEFEVMKEALSIKQLEEIGMKGSIELNKQQMIDTLKDDIRIQNELRENMMNNLENADEKVREMMTTCINNGEIIIKEQTELLNKLENDSEDYLQGFMKGTRG